MKYEQKNSHYAHHARTTNHADTTTHTHIGAAHTHSSHAPTLRPNFDTDKNFFMTRFLNGLPQPGLIIRGFWKKDKPQSLKKALVLAGGFGSRMHDLTKDTPKPMLPLHGKPILEYSIDLCRRYGIKDIGISIHHQGDQIKKYFGNGKKFGVRITYLEEVVPLGTGGVLRLHKKWFNQTFLMCNADELKDINLDAMYKQHIENKALATIALTQVENPSEYGVVEIREGQILRFVEKPKKEEAPSNLINAGLYILDPSVTNMIPEGYCMVEKDLFPQLAQQGRLFGFAFKGQWFDTGTPERYSYANENWDGFRQPIKNSRS